MATTIEIRIQLTNGQFVALIPIIKLDGTRFYAERREDDDNLISNRKCSECLHAQNITGLRIDCSDCRAKMDEVKEDA